MSTPPEALPQIPESTFTQSPARGLLLVVFSAVFTAGSLWMALTASDLLRQIVGWVGAIFFGLGVVMSIASLFRPMSVVINGEGIRIGGPTTSTSVPWHNIAAIGLVSTPTKMIGIRLRNANTGRENADALMALNNERTGGHVHIPFSAYGKSIEPMMAALKAWGPAMGAEVDLP